MRKTEPTAARRPRPQLFHIVLLATVLVALYGCAAFGSAGGTPSATATIAPTDTPASTETTEPSPPPTPEISPSATINHPTGATDVVLRVEWGGGFVPPSTTVSEAPQFTLYGDGTAVFELLPGANGVTYDQPQPAFLTGHMSEEAVQELLDYALHDTGLATAKQSYDYPGIADAGSTMFTVDAGGVDKTVSVYALYESTNDGPDKADRAALYKLQERLRNFETEARNGATASVSDYDPDAYKVVLFDNSTGSPPDGVQPIDWPWTDIQPSDFVVPDGSTWRLKIMDRDHTAKLTDVPNGGQQLIWAKVLDGSMVSFALRPLLPDEIAHGEPSST